jgi:hypothetical protein
MSEWVPVASAELSGRGYQALDLEAGRH